MDAMRLGMLHEMAVEEELMAEHPVAAKIREIDEIIDNAAKLGVVRDVAHLKRLFHARIVTIEMMEKAIESRATFESENARLKGEVALRLDTIKHLHEEIDGLNTRLEEAHRQQDIMTADEVRMRASLEASRFNEQKARDERDAAQMVISKVADYVAPSVDPQAMASCDGDRCYNDACNHARRIREILKVCSICGPRSRLGDAPCTHIPQIASGPCGCSAAVILHPDDPVGVGRCSSCGQRWRSCVATQKGT
jgi:hypothetical protein